MILALLSTGSYEFGRKPHGCCSAFVISHLAVVAAVQAYTKINAAGQWVDRSEHVNLNELFDRMTQQELESYARDGSLPQWFKLRNRLREHSGLAGS